MPGLRTRGSAAEVEEDASTSPALVRGWCPVESCMTHRISRQARVARRLRHCWCIGAARRKKQVVGLPTRPVGTAITPELDSTRHWLSSPCLLNPSLAPPALALCSLLRLRSLQWADRCCKLPRPSPPVHRRVVQAPSRPAAPLLGAPGLPAHLAPGPLLAGPAEPACLPACLLLAPVTLPVLLAGAALLQLLLLRADVAPPLLLSQ